MVDKRDSFEYLKPAAPKPSQGAFSHVPVFGELRKPETFMEANKRAWGDFTDKAWGLVDPGFDLSSDLGRSVAEGDWGNAAWQAPLLAMALLPGPNIKKGGLDRQLRKAKVLDEGVKKIPGAPIGVATPQAEAARRAAYKQSVLEGEKGRYWYEDGGRAIRDGAGDDSELANKLGETFAVTSSSTSVPGNTGFAIKGHNQAMAGVPVETGRFPKAMSKQIENIYYGDGTASGNKRTPFADQLAIGGDYYTKPEGVGQGHRAVHDIWDGESWGYVNADGTPLRRAFQQAEHNWMDEQMERVLADLGGNWTPGQAQAASWQTAKVRAGDVKPDAPILDYGTAMEPYTGQMSREAMPGKRVGDMPELLQAPLDERRAYDEEIAKLIYDPKMRDQIGMAYGALQRGTFKGPGVFEGDLNPGRQVRGAFGRKTQPDGSLEMDSGTRQLFTGIDSIYGLGTSQDAIAGHAFYPGAPMKSATGLDVPMGTTIDDDAMRRIIAMNEKFKDEYKLPYEPFAAVPTPGGVRLLNMIENPADNQFANMGKSVMSELGLDPKTGSFGQVSGVYNEAGDGFSNYINNINTLEDARAANGLPSGFDKVAPGLFAKINDLNKSTGYTLNQSMMDVRQAIADNGLAGLREMARKGLIPAAAMGIFAPYLDDESGGAPAGEEY